ncbi:MAG: DUF120 domain-containing protein [Candidatus Thorarchaeota archaeon]
MISPEMWFTLYALAKKGAVYRRQTLTTRELGEMLGVSQQTASRRIAECVNEGLVSRVHSVGGMIVQVTDRGREMLRQVLADLEAAFVPPSDEIIIEGVVTAGLGEGAYYVGIYSSRFEQALGFRPYPGTLNVKVIDEESKRAVSAMRKTPPLVVKGFSHEGRTFGDVICYRVKVNNRVDAAIVIAQRTHHGPDILEVIAPIQLRNELKLDDRNVITLRVVPLHRVDSTQ